MATHTSLSNLFTDIADEIRAKKGTSETIVADNFPTEIANIPSGGEEDLEEEMRILDLQYMLTHAYRPYSENDYTQAEIDKVDDLLNKLGGNNNG